MDLHLDIYFIQNSTTRTKTTKKVFAFQEYKAKSFKT